MPARTRRGLLPLLLVAGLAACRTAEPASTATASVVSTNTPAPATTAALAATAPAEPSATLAAAPSATPTAGAATNTPAASAEAAPSAVVSASLGAPGADLVEFVTDVTAPDGSDFAPGETFVKAWQVRNAGTTTWTTDYAIVFVRGDQLGGPASALLPEAVAPGQTVDLSVGLVAPNELGDYTGFWMLRNAAGVLFGLTPEGNQPIYVQIGVVAEPGATAPPAGTAGAVSISAATLSVGRETITGSCPQTFEFSGTYTSQGAGSVTYQLEAAADTPGFVFNLPAAYTANFDTAGPRTVAVSYNLEFSGSVSGQAWLHVLTPIDLESNRVSFKLTCQP
ncbi:MAG: hypothetical protein IT318_11995 [Anaerolineales bacterium]|nr:hypothetical protein [Anaerolineales bacterium]